MSNFDEIGKAALYDLEKKLVNTPILALFREDAPYTIETEAFDKQLGWALLLPRQDEKNILPIWYWSRTSNDAEPKYDITQLDRLAVVWAALMVRSYMEGSRIFVRTDHQATSYTLPLKFLQHGWKNCSHI